MGAAPPSPAAQPTGPLAVRMRPRTLDEVVGQQHLLGPGAPLRRLVEGSAPASVLLYGCWLMAKAEDPQQVMRQGARAFVVVMPIVGVYGVMQYYDPSPADSYWMTATAATRTTSSPSCRAPIRCCATRS